MNFRIKATVATAALIASAGGAWADCGIESGSVRILSNDFPALSAVNARAAECANDAVEVTANQTTEHRNIQVPALSANPATYTVAVVATSSIVPLLSDDLIRPLDEYVEKWGDQLLDSQKIVVGGKTMAIAFMANAQHLYYREDVLAEHGIEVPTTYDELFAAAEKLQQEGWEYPLSSNFMPGWNLAAEFINLYLGTGNQFFESGSANLAIDNEDGIAVLETMKTMTEYMSPDYITYDSNAQTPIWEAGEVALSIAWGSRAGNYIGDDAPDKAIADSTAFAAAPTLGDSSTPTAALWWDGFTIAKNISDEDAEASFRAMMHGTAPEVLEGNMDKAVWLIDGFEPTRAADGVIANLKGKAKPYPMLPYMGLLHVALGDNLAEFLQGQESAEQALADVKSAYTTAATEAGFLN